MATHRNLTNVGEPLQYPNGDFAANVPLWFTLVNSDDEPIWVLDATSGELVIASSTITTDADAEFTIALFPTDRASSACYYRLTAPSIPEFGRIISYVPTGTGDLLLSEFIALAGTLPTWTPSSYLVPPGGTTGQVVGNVDGVPLWVEQTGGTGGGVEYFIVPEYVVGTSTPTGIVYKVTTDPDHNLIWEETTAAPNGAVVPEYDSNGDLTGIYYTLIKYDDGTFEWQETTYTPPSTSGGVTDHLLLTHIGVNTHAQIDTALSRLANTSGTNTGDQDLSGYSLTSHNHFGVYDPAGSAATVQGNLNTHAGLSTTAHGGIVASTDARLTDSRTPTTHGNDKHSATYITASDAVAPNAAISGATKTKITYDAKGLVTAGADATAADVGAVPTSRTVNSKALSSDISLTYTDVGAAASGHTHVDRIVAIFDGGGSVVAANKKVYVLVPFAATITAAHLFADTSTTTSVDIWKYAHTGFAPGTHPVVGDSIVASAPVAVSAGVLGGSDLTGWTTSITADDVLCFNVTSNNNATWLNVTLTVTRA